MSKIQGMNSSLVLGMCLSIAALAGCAREEPIMHVETPSGDVEVNRNLDTGEVTVDVDEE